jgi:hypothetical protein
MAFEDNMDLSTIERVPSRYFACYNISWCIELIGFIERELELGAYISGWLGG